MLTFSNYPSARSRAEERFPEGRALSDEPIQVDEIISRQGQEADIKAIPDMPYLLLVRSTGTDTPFRIISGFVEESTADIVGNTLFPGRYEIKSREDWLAICSTAVYTDHVIVGTLDTPPTFIGAATSLRSSARQVIYQTIVNQEAPSNEAPNQDTEDTDNGG